MNRHTGVAARRETGMRDVLEALAEGRLTPSEAEARLRGYVTNDAGRFDATRKQRSGVPEAILATGKTDEELVTLAEASLSTTARAILTRIEPAGANAVRSRLAETHPDATLRYDERAGVLVVHSTTFEPPDLDATVGVVTAGTSDAVPAREAATVVREMGAGVELIEDVGVASLDRLLDQLPLLRRQDVLVVAAGREGALPTVLAGLVDVPIIAVPVSTGYGHGGDGAAALAGMLQSCTALSVVNVDAGFTAGAQAGLIARQLDTARSGSESGGT